MICGALMISVTSVRVSAKTVPMSLQPSRGYVSGKLRYHLHFGVKAYDHDREVSYYCAWLRSYVYA